MSLTVRPDWMTLSEIRAEVDLIVRDNSLTDANLNGYINKAYRWMFYDQLWPTRKTSGTITMVEDQKAYELPSDLDVVDFANYGNNPYLVQTTAQNKAEYGGNPSNSGERRFIVDGYSASIQPTPGSEEDGEDFSLTYWQNIFVYDTSGDKVAGILVNDTDYPALEGNLHRLLAEKAALIGMSLNREGGAPPAVMDREFKSEYAKAVFLTIQKPSYPNGLRIRI